MSKYGLTRYGLGYYGLGDEYKYLTPYFTATPVGYGALRIDWIVPGGSWSELVLVRNTLGFPVDPDDGETVLISDTGLPLTSPDSGLHEGTIYYYSLFVKDTTFNLWHKSGEVAGISVKNFNTEDYMWELIPTGMRSNTRNLIDGADENQSLRKFVRMLAFEYDLEKTQAYIMTPAYDKNKISHLFLPTLLNQFGMDFEPSIGYQRARSLAANAISIYKSKGSLYGLREFIKSFSGYDCEITSGKNLMLDYNSSSFEESVGAWESDSSATLSAVDSNIVQPYNEPTLPVQYPNRQLGALKLQTNVGGGILIYCGSSSPLTLGVPVTAGVTYTFSVYTQAATATRSSYVAVRWHDRKGTLLSADTGASSTNSIGSWTRVSVTAAAPTGAVFAVPCIGLSSVSSSETHYFDAAQFEAAGSATDFEDARVVKVHLLANRINELSNPNFEVATSPWTFSGTAHEYIVTSSGPNAHNTLSGFALELYPNAPLTVMNSEHLTEVLAGNSYAFSVYAELESYGATPQATDLITPKIKWYNASNTLLKTDVGTPIQGSLTDWVRVSVVGTAPTGASYAVASVEWPASSYNLSIVFDTALFEKNAFVDSFFDGTSGFANVSDIMWEGTPDASRSYYYKNFSAIYTRLNELLPDYLTLGSSFQISYA